MLNKIECNLAKHLHDAEKGIIPIAKIINRRRGVKYDYDLLTDVAECVNCRIAVIEVHNK